MNKVIDKEVFETAKKDLLNSEDIIEVNLSEDQRNLIVIPRADKKYLGLIDPVIKFYTKVSDQDGYFSFGDHDFTCKEVEHFNDQILSMTFEYGAVQLKTIDNSEDVVVGGEYNLSELLDSSEGANENEILDSGSVAIYYIDMYGDKDDMIAEFDIIERDNENPYDSLVKITHIS